MFTQDADSISSDSWKVWRSIIQMWKQNINEPKQAFWNNLKLTKTIEVYETWVKMEIPILPRKLFPKIIWGKIEDQQIICQTAILTSEVEIKIMKNKSIQFQEKYLKADDTVYKINNAKSKSKDEEQLLTSGTKNTRNKSWNLRKYVSWKNKQTWLESYAIKYRLIFFSSKTPKRLLFNSM